MSYSGFKIAFVHNTMSIGGIEKSFLNILDYIDYTKYSVDFYLLSMSDDLVSEINPNVNVIYRVTQLERALAKYAKGYKGVPSKIFVFLMKSLRVVRRRIATFPVVGKYVLGSHISTHYNAVFALSQGISQVFALNILSSAAKYSFYHNGNVAAFNANLQHYEKFKGIILVSSTLLSLIKEEHPSLKERLMVINNIVPYAKVRMQSHLQVNEHTMPMAEYTFVSCGRMSSEKGFDLAINAAQILCDKNIMNFVWYLVGDGKERARLENRIIIGGLEKHVKVVGWKVNPYPYMRICDIYVQPSRVESFGLSMVEAQILDKIVISTRTAGAEEVISDGETGLICQMSAEGITDAILRIIEDPYLAERIRYNVRNINFEKRNLIAIERLYRLIE